MTIEAKKKQWENTTLIRSMEKAKIDSSKQRLYTPEDIKGHDFLTDVGFPGEPPFTAGAYATDEERILDRQIGSVDVGGYGTAEDTRDYYRLRISLGQFERLYMHIDLPTHAGLDSDHPLAEGEIGQTGIAIDSLADFETLYEAFTGPHEIDKMVSSWIASSVGPILIAMYLSLADKRGISWASLRGGAQNDILKEYIARGQYIFPPGPSLRLVRDTMGFCVKNVPGMYPLNILGYQMREAGATGEQTLGFTMSNAIAYINTALEAGLDIDEIGPQITFLGFGGSMQLFHEVALHRAARRMWTKIMRDRFGAKLDESLRMRSFFGAQIGNVDTVPQRPLNNLVRSVIGGIASIVSGGGGDVRPPYDEPLGLGHSMEARQLCIDASRILRFETDLLDVHDPLAGSYYIESLTDQIEEGAWREVEKIQAMGGAVAAIQRGYMQKEIASNAYKTHKDLEAQKRVIVGFNMFTGSNELEVIPARQMNHPYSQQQLITAGDRQIQKLKYLREHREQAAVVIALNELKKAAEDPNRNIFPSLINAVKVYATIGEICNVLREVFGMFQDPMIGINTLSKEG